MVDVQLPKNTSQPSSKPDMRDDVFRLMKLRDPREATREALAMTMQRFEAKAGSLLFRDQISGPMRIGPFHSQVLEKIQQWEEVIGRRFKESSWRMGSDTGPLVSASKIGNDQLVNVPLVRDDYVIGALTLVVDADPAFTTAQSEQLVRLAKGIGQSLTLVTDLESANERLRQMEVFYRVGQALMTTFDVNKLLSDTMQLAADVVDAGAASLMLIDHESEELVFEVSHGSRSHLLRQQRIPLDEGIGGWVARHGQPVVVNDARSDPRFSHRVDVRTGFLTQSIAAVPLKLKGKVIGVLEVLNKYSGDGFNREDVQLMTAIASQAAVAIENARLHQQVLAERDRIIKAQEDVRRELNRKLHDGPVQLLSAMTMSLDRIERLTEAAPPTGDVIQSEIETLRNLTQQANRETRNILFELRPVTLETQGLVAALEQYVSQLQHSDKFALHFETINYIDLDLNTAATIFAIVQEAINNIKRHSRARNVWLTLDVRNDYFIVSIRDDGVGFDPSVINADSVKQGSFGMLNMHERAALIEAQLNIESSMEPPRRGTMVQLLLPLP